jgi:hypothetical protein
MMELIMVGKIYLIGHLSHTLESGIRTINIGCQFMTMVSLEGIFLVRLQLKKHAIPL